MICQPALYCIDDRRLVLVAVLEIVVCLSLAAVICVSAALSVSSLWLNLDVLVSYKV